MIGLERRHFPDFGEYMMGCANCHFDPQVKYVKEHFTYVYVKNLKHSVSEKELRQKFEDFGGIQYVQIPSRKADGGVSKGVSFVNFYGHNAAVKAVKEMHEASRENSHLNNLSQPLYVARLQRQSERKHVRDQMRRKRQNRPSIYVLYIKNLDGSVDDRKLKSLFEKFGDIVSARVIKDPITKVSRKFGFVSFCESDAAVSALTEMNGKIIRQSSKPLFVSIAHKKEDRRKQEEPRFSQRGARGPQGLPEQTPVVTVSPAQPQHFAQHPTTCYPTTNCPQQQQHPVPIYQTPVALRRMGGSREGLQQTSTTSMKEQRTSAPRSGNADSRCWGKTPCTNGKKLNTVTDTTQRFCVPPPPAASNAQFSAGRFTRNQRGPRKAVNRSTQS